MTLIPGPFLTEETTNKLNKEFTVNLDSHFNSDGTRRAVDYVLPPPGAPILFVEVMPTTGAHSGVYRTEGGKQITKAPNGERLLPHSNNEYIAQGFALVQFYEIGQYPWLGWFMGQPIHKCGVGKRYFGERHRVTNCWTGRVFDEEGFVVEHQRVAPVIEGDIERIFAAHGCNFSFLEIHEPSPWGKLLEQEGQLQPPPPSTVRPEKNWVRRRVQFSILPSAPDGDLTWYESDFVFKGTQERPDVHVDKAIAAKVQHMRDNWMSFDGDHRIRSIPNLTLGDAARESEANRSGAINFVKGGEDSLPLAVFSVLDRDVPMEAVSPKAYEQTMFHPEIAVEKGYVEFSVQQRYRLNYVVAAPQEDKTLLQISAETRALKLVEELVENWDTFRKDPRIATVGEVQINGMGAHPGKTMVRETPTGDVPVAAFQVPLRKPKD